MFGSFLIGLREGLEASLVVGILAAYLVRTGNRRVLPPMWAGVAAAVALSLGFGYTLSLVSAGLRYTTRELFGGIVSLLAVGLVTWMVLWMSRAARHLRHDLETRLDDALRLGAGAVVGVAFVAVAREGVETALFLWSSIRAAGRTVEPVAGAVLGLAAAVVLGWLIHRGGIRLDLRRFFTWTGALLIVVAAGVFGYAGHELQEAGVLPGGGARAFDLSAAIPPASWYGSLLSGLFGFDPNPSWLRLLAWLGYLVPVMYLYLRATTRTTAPAVPVRSPETA